MEEKSQSKISNVEWGLFIGALLVIDIIQIVIEWLFIWIAGASIAINFCIDLFVAMAIPFYLQMRGESMADKKRIFGLAGAFLGEIIPLVDELPLWTLDGIFMMVLSKSDKIIKSVPGVNNLIKMTPKNKPETNSVAEQGQELDKAA